MPPAKRQRRAAAAKKTYVGTEDDDGNILISSDEESSPPPAPARVVQQVRVGGQRAEAAERKARGATEREAERDAERAAAAKEAQRAKLAQEAQRAKSAQEAQRAEAVRQAQREAQRAEAAQAAKEAATAASEAVSAATAARAAEQHAAAEVQDSERILSAAAATLREAQRRHEELQRARQTAEADAADKHALAEAAARAALALVAPSGTRTSGAGASVEVVGVETGVETGVGAEAGAEAEATGEAAGAAGGAGAAGAAGAVGAAGGAAALVVADGVDAQTDEDEVEVEVGLDDQEEGTDEAEGVAAEGEAAKGEGEGEAAGEGEEEEEAEVLEVHSVTEALPHALPALMGLAGPATFSSPAPSASPTNEETIAQAPKAATPSGKSTGEGVGPVAVAVARGGPGRVGRVSACSQRTASSHADSGTARSGAGAEHAASERLQWRRDVDRARQEAIARARAQAAQARQRAGIGDGGAVSGRHSPSTDGADGDDSECMIEEARDGAGDDLADVFLLLEESVIDSTLANDSARGRQLRRPVANADGLRCLITSNADWFERVSAPVADAAMRTEVDVARHLERGVAFVLRGETSSRIWSLGAMEQLLTRCHGGESTALCQELVKRQANQTTSRKIKDDHYGFVRAPLPPPPLPLSHVHVARTRLTVCTCHGGRAPAASQRRACRRRPHALMAGHSQDFSLEEWTKLPEATRPVTDRRGQLPKLLHVQARGARPAHPTHRTGERCTPCPPHPPPRRTRPGRPHSC